MRIAFGRVMVGGNRRWIAAVSCGIAFAVIEALGSQNIDSNSGVKFTDSVPNLGGKNLVPNGSFDVGAAGWSSLGHGAGDGNAWAPLGENWGNFESLHGTVEQDSASPSRHFLRIRLGGENTPVFNFDYFYPVNHRELRPLAASVGWIEVVPGEPYTISVNLRASRRGTRGSFGVHDEDAGRGWSGSREEILEQVQLTKRWKRYSRTFTPKYPYVFVLAGPDLAQEEDVAVDVSDVQLEKGTEATAYSPRSPVEVGITPNALEGVFTSGELGELTVAAYNASEQPSRTSIEFSVTDFFDAKVELASLELELPPKSRIEREVPLPPEWRGFYRVVAKYKTAGLEESHLLRLAIVPVRTAAETVIGVNHAYPTKNLLALAKKAGVTWYRDWSLKWQQIEPQKGVFRWDLTDAQADRVTQQGLNLMANVPFPSAEWNSTAPSLETLKSNSTRYKSGGKGDDQELLIRARWAWLPRDVNELVEFVQTAVGRYRNKIQVWEFLNEPLFTLYSLPNERALASSKLKAYTFKDYLDLLKTVAPGIRSANPKAQIMGGGLFPGDKQCLQMIEGGVLDEIDIFGVHDYPRFLAPEKLVDPMDKLVGMMKQHGGAKPIWMTEFSYFGTDDLPRNPFVPIPGLWSEPQLHSEKEVADYVIRYSTIFLGHGGKKIFLHSGATGSVNRPGTESCMFTDGAVRKVFPAVAVFTELMGANPEFVSETTVDGCLLYGFENGSHSVLVIWKPEGKKIIPVPAGVKCANLMGQALSNSTVELTGSPIYLVGPPGQSQAVFAECVGSL